MDPQRLLAACEWFRLLPAEQRDMVLRTSVARQLQIDECVGHRGFAVNHWMGVCAGLLKASASSADGKLRSAVLASAGEWAGEAEILLGRPLAYDVVALEPSTVLLVSARTFKWLVANNLSFVNFAMWQLATRSAAEMNRFERSRQPAGAQAVC